MLYFYKTLEIHYLQICNEKQLASQLLTHYTYLLRSRIAPSFVSFRAASNALTLSDVARRRFSNLGSSQRRSALSRTSCCRKHESQMQSINTMQTSSHHFQKIKYPLTQRGPFQGIRIKFQNIYHLKYHIISDIGTVQSEILSTLDIMILWCCIVFEYFQWS